MDVNNVIQLQPKLSEIEKKLRLMVSSEEMAAELEWAANLFLEMGLVHEAQRVGAVLAEARGLGGPRG